MSAAIPAARRSGMQKKVHTFSLNFLPQAARVSFPPQSLNPPPAARVHLSPSPASTRQVLSSYRALFRVIRTKPIENQPKLFDAVRHQFRQRMTLDKKGTNLPHACTA